MPLTDGNNTNPPTYAPVKDIGSDDNDVENDDDIVPTPGINTEEPMLALTLFNWCACRCNLEIYITKPAPEEEKAAWDKDLMPVRKRFDSFEDSQGYYRILGCRKLSSDEYVDATFKREKKKILSIARKSHPENISGIPGKENVAKLKDRIQMGAQCISKMSAGVWNNGGRGRSWHLSEARELQQRGGEH